MPDGLSLNPCVFVFCKAGEQSSNTPPFPSLSDQSRSVSLSSPFREETAQFCLCERPRGSCGSARRRLLRSIPPFPEPGSSNLFLQLRQTCSTPTLPIFEWWYFRKYGTSFIEQVSVSHLRPLLGAVDNNSPSVHFTASNGEAESNRQNVSECKVWRNPLNLFRGAEYSRYTWVTGREPLTYYDMNLSAQDHQTFFTCDTDHARPADAVMQKAWRERNAQARMKAAYQALELNNECATAYVLLAEEETTTILEAEKLFKQALKAGEVCYRRSQQLQHHSTQQEAQHRRDTNVLVYIKRRLAMCARKLGRIREAVKLMRDLMKEFPLLSMLNVHENLLEALLELQAYADVQVVLAKYDDISLPKSATICYTAALLKARAVSDKFSPEAASRRGLSTAEMNAVEAIHRAVEFNPHVPKLSTKFPFILRRSSRSSSCSPLDYVHSLRCWHSSHTSFRSSWASLLRLSSARSLHPSTL
ncbi:suppressor of tumorigenicity 7 protein homolog isoform X4 [Scyliorhinus torazame]|uniref:suppressor of tumorigenicity 7 protein homolog isoform X4 n=1 Tax=Scyliorhinus torazame TaxID=75743 RepID=UPI003B59C13B